MPWSMAAERNLSAPAAAGGIGVEVVARGCCHHHDERSESRPREANVTATKGRKSPPETTTRSGTRAQYGSPTQCS